MAMTNAERQKKHRDKIARLTFEEHNKEVERIKRNVHRYIDQLSWNHLYAIEPLLYSIISHYQNEKQLEKIMNMGSYAKTQINYETDWE